MGYLVLLLRCIVDLAGFGDTFMMATLTCHPTCCESSQKSPDKLLQGDLNYSNYIPGGCIRDLPYSLHAN